MTIYKPKSEGGRKLGQKVERDPNIFINDDTLPLTLAKGDESIDVSSVSLVRSRIQSGERFFMKFCALSTIVVVFIFAGFLGFFLRQQLYHYKPFVTTINVQFHEYERGNADESGSVTNQIKGAFYEQVEIDWKMERYAKLNMPPFIDSKQSIVLHDFSYNLSAIVDHEMSHCFVMPLNRSTVNPPRLFLEFVDLVRAGYSVPSAKVQRKTYSVVTPPLSDIIQLGEVIWSECHYYDTYRLAKDDEPIAMSKRFACQFSGSTYSLGETGFPLLELITLDMCL